MLKALAPHRAARTDAAAMLAAVGAPVTETTIRDARVQILFWRDLRLTIELDDDLELPFETEDGEISSRGGRCC